MSVFLKPPPPYPPPPAGEGIMPKKFVMRDQEQKAIV